MKFWLNSPIKKEIIHELATPGGWNPEVPSSWPPEKFAGNATCNQKENIALTLDTWLLIRNFQ
jgi:hypothetical protein